MLVTTTIYFTELKDLNRGAEQTVVPLEPSAVRSCELFRELLSLYEGRNRVLPIDRNS